MWRKYLARAISKSGEGSYKTGTIITRELIEYYSSIKLITPCKEESKVDIKHISKPTQ
jgi:hypothetical protein